MRKWMLKTAAMLAGLLLAAGAGFLAGRTAAADRAEAGAQLAVLQDRLTALEQAIHRDGPTGVPGDVSPPVRDTLTARFPQGHVVDHHYDPLGFWHFTVRSERTLYDVEMCNGGDLVRDPTPH